MNRRDRIEDELLVLKSQEGDASAFERLVGRWQERLWRHAWRLVGDEDAAWDVLQEAWIGISRGLPRLEDAACFPGWAYRIVSNKCRDRIRRQRRQRQAVEAYCEQLDRAGSDASVAEERCASLREALRRLSGHDRAILSLRYEEDFGTAAIAAILEIPEGTVKSRLHWARRRLRQLMEQQTDE